MTRPDFVKVRLNQAGQQLAGGGELHVIEGHHEFTFRGTEQQEVTRSLDWEKVLEPRGLFEIVEPATAVAERVQPPATVLEVPKASAAPRSTKGGE